MKKKVKSSIAIYLFIILISICLFLLIVFNFYGLITGRGFFPLSSLTNVLSRAIIGEAMPQISISSPQNTTYNFGAGDSYLIDLNVSSANIDVDRWWFNLYDLRHNLLIANRTIFTPNTIITAVRWSNRLEVYVNDSSGNIYNQNVTFFVSVPNSAPLLQNLTTEHFACEDGVFSYLFYASDNDEDNLTASISPTGSFFVNYFMSNANLTWRSSEIFSGILGKSKAGLHKEAVSVSDGSLSDNRNINISVIEINHAPFISVIGAQSVSVFEGNNSFYYEVQVSDLEHGNNESSGNFTFNLTFLSGNRFFNISAYGIINASVNSGQIGVYNMSVCVNDSGLSAPHANISSVCGTNGGSTKTCINFSLTVTEENQRPNITSYSPTNLSFSANGTDTNRFNITKHDLDGGIPDGYWYVDNVFKELDSGSSVDEFSYSFGCGVSGAHSVKAVVSDGLLNNSVEWSVDVKLVSCAPAPPPGAGGGGGGVGIPPSIACKPKWGCFAWGDCELVDNVLKTVVLSEADYGKVKGFCNENNLSEEYCGYQKRTCEDINYCNSTLEEPEKTQGCKYIFIPSCSDGLKNCHDDDCEVLTDCGGPCDACPTCSDGIKNQDEEEVDCGGPCPIKCPEKGPVYTHYYNLFLIFLFIILGVIAIAIAIKVYRGMKKFRQRDAL